MIDFIELTNFIDKSPVVINTSDIGCMITRDEIPGHPVEVKFNKSCLPSLLVSNTVEQILDKIFN